MTNIDSQIIQAVLQNREIAYLVTDSTLRVVDMGGALGILNPAERSGLGQSLLDVVPELIGSEAVLQDVLDGTLPQYELEWINRETDEGYTHYVNLVDLPHYAPEGDIKGLIHLVQAFDEMGASKQLLAQQRNDLRLLQDRLKQQNLELEAANAELQRLDEMKSQFVSIAAHELRSPLTAIQVYIQLLLAKHLGPLRVGQQESLEVMQQSVRRLTTITNDLLDVTRIEAGRLELNLEIIEFRQLVDEVVAEIKPQLRAKKQRFTLNVRADLPPVLCDKTRTLQILVNLLSNAIKYTLEGGAIELSLAPASQEGFIQVSVSETGIGISEEDQQKLFGRFFRASSAQQTKASGTGLGLHITRALVELHGGRIWFESTLGEGSTFYVTFPTTDAVMSEATDAGDTSAEPFKGLRTNVSETVTDAAALVNFAPTVATVPQKLRLELKQAAISADIEHIDQLVREIHVHNPELASHLATLAHEFDYTQIINLVDV